MHVFDENNVIRKVASAEEVLFRFFKHKQKYYVKRKAYLLQAYAEQLVFINAKIKFIEGIMNETIHVFRKKEQEVVNQLTEQKFPLIDQKYKYLLDMKINAFTDEKLSSLKQEYKVLETKKESLELKSINCLWIEDIENLGI